MGIVGNFLRRYGCFFCRLDIERWGFVLGISISCLVLFSVNLYFFFVIVVIIYCRLDIRRRYRKEFVIFVLLGVGEEYSF